MVLFHGICTKDSDIHVVVKQVDAMVEASLPRRLHIVSVRRATRESWDLAS